MKIRINIRFIVGVIAILGLAILFMVPYKVTAYPGSTVANNLTSTTEYVLYDLGRGGGYEINDLGQITGRMFDQSTGRSKAFIWSKEDGFTDLGFGTGRTINNNGQVAGDAWIWSQKNGFTPVENPQEENGISLQSINNSGQISGWLRRSAGGYNAILWPTPDNLTVLESLGGTGASSWANGLNDSGVAVGESNIAVDTGSRAAIWDSQGNVHSIPGIENTISAAYNINNLGQVVGLYWNPDYRRAFVYTPGSGIRDLGTLGGGDHSEADAISETGWVAGSSMYLPGNSTFRAFVWNKNDGMIDLGSLGGVKSYAGDINSSNQVVGTFFDSQGYDHIALWEPVTKPTFNITGKVTLSNFDGNNSSIPVMVEVRRKGSNTITSTVALQSDGSYSLTGINNGFYDIAFKASHWLQRTVNNVGVYEDTSLNVVLINGDVDGNNVIDAQDQDLLKKANGSTPDSRKWNPNADLNGDNKVNRLDKEILRENLGQSGDL